MRELTKLPPVFTTHESCFHGQLGVKEQRAQVAHLIAMNESISIQRNSVRYFFNIPKIVGKQNVEVEHGALEELFG